MTISGPAIEDLVPDYGILDQIEYRYPVRDAYFAYASRGCIRKCTSAACPSWRVPSATQNPSRRSCETSRRCTGPRRT